MDSTFLSGLTASTIAGACTGLGALPIFLRRQWGETSRTLMLAAAAGVMLGATVFSLIVPALGMVTARGGSEREAVLVVGIGLLLGAVAIWLLHALTPHEHFVKGREGPQRSGLGRYGLFVVAITLHNFPEGASVGVAWGAGDAAGVAVATGIGLQNLPEGLAVAAALLADGSSRARAFWIACLTGFAEPIGGVFGALFTTLGESLLPYGLAAAAGAMLFVVSGEVIPETHRDSRERSATFALVLGFVAMMVVDAVLG
jgi:ZIP family zinc transporter